MTHLTDAEHRAMELTAELVKVVCLEVIGDEETRDQDIREFVYKIHGIQHMIMSQAAGRAHPDLYRGLGTVIQ